MEVLHGEGGDDSKKFVHELFAAYVKYANENRLTVSILHASEGHITASFKGEGVERYFKNEAGKHVCQRIPSNDKKGRKHTSIVSVAVLPLPDKKTPLIPENEIETTFQRGSGPGGQHKNMTDSAVRMVHKPTKLSVLIDGRDQHANKRKARKILTAKVQQLYLGKKKKERAKARKEQMGGGKRGNKIRTYNFIENRAKDHRTNKKATLKQVMKGRFNLLEREDG